MFFGHSISYLKLVIITQCPVHWRKFANTWNSHWIGCPQQGKPGFHTKRFSFTNFKLGKTIYKPSNFFEFYSSLIDNKCWSNTVNVKGIG